MARLIEKILPFAAGAGVVGFLDFLLVEGAGAAGVAYDLAHEGYIADFLATRDSRELLDFHELNLGEAVSLMAIVASLAMLFFATSRRRTVAAM